VGTEEVVEGNLYLSVYPETDVSCGIGQTSEKFDGHIDLYGMRKRTESERGRQKWNKNEYVIEVMEMLPIDDVAVIVMLESEGVMYDHYRNGIDARMRRCLVLMKQTGAVKVRYIDLDSFMNRVGLSRVI